MTGPVNIEMLRITSSLLGSTSTIHPTLVWDQDTVILVDAGFPGQLDQIRQAMAQAGVLFERLNKVILTHHDIDHIGSLASIQKELPGRVETLAYVDEKPYIDGQKRPLKLAQLEASLDTLPPERIAVYEKLKAGFAGSRAEVDRTLSDGEELPECGGITVIHTPGHTLGHICLYLPATKTLIAGDALRVEGGQLVKTPAAANFDQLLYAQSLQKLAQFAVERVISYHGGLLEGSSSQRIAELAEQE